MSISRRLFILGTAAGLFLAPYYDKVISISKYRPRAMGQCPECRGFIVQLNLDYLFAEKFGAQQREQGTTSTPVEAGEATTWHCLECGHRF